MTATERQEEPYSGPELEWARDKASRLANDGLVKGLFPTALLLTITISLNHFFAETFYTWLNANYTPFQIVAYWTFGISA
jgi:hypothetical protein